MNKRVRVRKTLIPGVFTLFNLFFGFLAIVVSAQGEFRKAAWLILAAALFDGLDGKLARLFKSPSKFGVEFDSLADLISFCTAPAVIVYFAYVRELHPLLAASISFIPLIFGSVRLARFNVKHIEKPLSFFVGLTTTMNAVVLASFVLFEEQIFGNPGDPRVALPLVFLLSFLMISPVRYHKLPDLNVKKWGKTRLIFLPMFLIATALWQGLVLFPLSILYVVWGFINWLIHHDRLEIELEVDSLTFKNPE